MTRLHGNFAAAPTDDPFPPSDFSRHPLNPLKYIELSTKGSSVDTNQPLRLNANGGHAWKAEQDIFSVHEFPTEH